MQSTLTSVADDDPTSNGKGVAETSMIIYNVDSVCLDSKEAKRQLVEVPKENLQVRFYLNQSFLKTQERHEDHMIHVFSSHISMLDDNPRLFGAILYDEFGNDDIKLNMFSANFTDIDEEFDDARSDVRRSINSVLD